jgi:hypothetical protein
MARFGLVMRPTGVPPGGNDGVETFDRAEARRAGIGRILLNGLSERHHSRSLRFPHNRSVRVSLLHVSNQPVYYSI